MKSIRIILLTLIMLIGVSESFAQVKKSRKLQKADSYFAVGEYLEALELYTKLYPKSKTKTEKADISFNAGMCCRGMFDANGSLKWFRRAITSKHQNPIIHLYVAEAYKVKGEYEDAKEYYLNYKDLVPNDIRGENGIMSCDLALEWIETPTRYKVASIRYLNSRNNDFAPAYAGDSTELYFTSTREGTTGKEVNKNSGQSFADIFYARKDKKGKWSQAVPIEGLINTPFDEGSCSLTPNGRTMYYTSCQVIKDVDMGCKIYKSEISDGKWGEPELIKVFSDSAISVGHPHITADELTLYFVSDHKERGIGGKDIWKMERQSKSAAWGSPEILSEDVNTKSNELFPSTDINGNLYFSSDGHITMGGLDIFIAIPKGNGAWEVENMKCPINSSGNDFGIIFNGDKKNGYLSSSRKSPGKIDDVYYFYQQPLKIILKGYVINEKSSAFIPNVSVKLDGSNGEKNEVKTTDLGFFTFDLKEKTDYLFEGIKQNYFKGKANETTKGITENTTINVEIFMMPNVGNIEIENIQYAVGDTTLTEVSKVAIEELIDLLNENPITIELKSNTDYRGSDPDNLKLSQGRANSVVAFLIEKGIDEKRLVAKGYGETTPATVNQETAKKFPFLKVGDVLDPAFIDALPSKEQQDECHQLNRRTEFEVLSQDYGIKHNKFGDG